jgi:hypothetical protein
MKKLLLGIIIILGVCMIISCGAKNEADTSLENNAIDLDNIQQSNAPEAQAIINAGVENNDKINQNAEASKEKDIDMIANDDEILSDDQSNEQKTEFVLKAIVKKVENDRLVVEVIESDYAFGIYHILTASAKYYNKNGSQVTRDSIMVGDTIELTYSGQTMLSYTPQVVAYQIRLAN